MKYVAVCFVCLSAILWATQIAIGEEANPSPVFATKGWSTIAMGGVEVSPQQLRAMQEGDYILHAKEGRLRKVPVQKTRLPHDPCGHVQRLALFVGADKTIYAAQCSVLSQSTDGGKTWTHLRRETSGSDVPENHFMQMRVLADGSWIQGRTVKPGQIAFFKSKDMGQSWQEVSRIGKTLETEDVRLGSPEVLRDGSLVVPVTAVYSKEDEWTDVRSVFYRSEDGGKTLSGPTTIGHWGHEINVAQLPSGRLLAVIRYQRPLLPSDPSNILELTGAKRWNHSFPYKHVFVADSIDGGKTWSRNRQVTTECGQCHGAAVGLRNKRVVMVYDHRYPRPMSSARAVVSDDEGKMWRDEVYYLSNGLVAGFARTITLDGEEMLTLTGSYYGEKLGWNDVTGNTQFHIIRWRLQN
ncbi:MAG: hypothetical protein CMJ64_12535 [Planctomycetaceae bacterium]|nr:hypothetical protein [Planctomycetaceae bacterium]